MAYANGAGGLILAASLIITLILLILPAEPDDLAKRSRDDLLSLNHDPWSESILQTDLVELM